MGALLLYSPDWNTGSQPDQAPPQALEAAAEVPPAGIYAISDTEVLIAPSSDTAVLGTMPEGEVVRVIGEDAGSIWVAISFPADSEGLGWVPANALSGRIQPGATQASTKLATSPGAVAASSHALAADAIASAVKAPASGGENSDAGLALIAIATALGMTLLPAALSKLS
jgi:hypothetical protein